jgi:ATP synthase protein I
MNEEPAGDGSGGGDKNRDSFDRRLAAARERAKLETIAPGAAKGQGGADSSALNMAMRLGIELVAAMVIAVAIGYGLDRLFHTSPWLMIAFVPVGAIAGFRNLMRAMGPKA